MKDEEFIAAFENCSLAAKDFHHLDHVRMAFLYLARFPILEAIQRFSLALERLATATGKPNLYHETITWAFLFLIRERLVEQTSRLGDRQPSWDEFTAANPDLLNRKSIVILRDYYFEETFASELAKKVFILPNRSLAAQEERGAMKATILMGVGREIHSVPDRAFVKSIKGIPARMAARLAFMTRDHHKVRDFVVRELPKEGKPLSPTQIGQVTGMSLQKVSAIVAQLEQNLFFLVRDRQGKVSWAFPVTADKTPHRLRFSTGERIFGT